MVTILMGVLVGHAFVCLVGWAYVTVFKRTPIDIEIGAVCPGLALLVVTAMSLIGIANAIDFQRWLNNWADELKEARQLRGGPC